MQIITIGGFKGGTGKTTMAALLSVAAVNDGLRVAALDLDRNTRNMSSFVTKRRAAGLPSPDHVMLLDLDDPTNRKSTGRLEPLARMARMDGYDLLIIDTSSGNLADVYEAHLLADAILTPMNESPADLHGLFTPPGGANAPKINYREMIDTVRFDRRRAGLPEQRWHVCVNRVAALPTRLGAIVQDQIERLSQEAGFEAAWRVRDRVAHRSIAQDGRTVFEKPLDGKLTMSELSGRTEIRSILSILQTRTQRAAAMAA
jgi:chromosome partitioning protein